MKIEVDGIVVDLKVGCDPEVFVEHQGKPVSAFGMVKGTKEKPFPVTGGGVQVDGMALEFNTDPCESREEFLLKVMGVKDQLLSMIPQGHSLLIQPTAEFGSEYIQSQPEEAQELGCMPDSNAYMQGTNNPRPNGSTDFRAAGGHLHLGWTEGAHIKDKEHVELCCKVIQLMDLFLGVPSVLVDPDTKRRSMYGQAGAFRAKPYGVEYRTLSNFWIKTESTISWAYNQSQKVIESFLKGFTIDQDDLVKIQKVINQSDQDGAKELVSKYKLEVPGGI